MKKRLLILFTLILTLGVFSMSVFAAGPDVTFSTDAPAAGVSAADTFQVKVTSAEVTGASSVAVKVSFDTSVFEVTDIQWNLTIPSMAKSTKDNANTSGSFGGSYVDNETFNDLVIPANSTFVTATLKVKEGAAVGESIIELKDFKPADMYASPIDVNINPTTLTIKVKAAPADKTALTDAIAAVEYVAVSADGLDVEPTDKWTTQAAKTALEGAVAAAQAVADNADATQQQVDDAVTALATAVSSYETAQQYGTKPAPADKKSLTDAIAAVEYVVVSADGLDVEPTDKWTTQAAKTALEGAVAVAQAVADNADATQQQVDDAVTALATAVSSYEAAQQYGTKIYAFDVLVDQDVIEVYDEEGAYPVCNGLLAYVEKESETEAVEMSFIPGANDGGVYNVTLDVAFAGESEYCLEFLFSELPTKPSVIEWTSGDSFNEDFYSDWSYNSDPTGEGGTYYYSLYKYFDYNLELNGELNATFTATLPRSDGEPVERTINLTVRHNPDRFPDAAADFSKLLGDRNDLYPANIWQGVMFFDDNDWLTSEQVLSGTENGYRAFAVKADNYVDVALAFETSEYEKVIFWDLYDSTGELFDDDDYYEIENELIGESEVEGYRSNRNDGINTSSEAGPWLLVATNIRGDYLPIVLSLTDVSDEGDLVLPEWQVAWNDIIAEYEATYTVTISGGGSGAGEYAVGDTVNINAGSRSGYTFKGWISDDVTITNASSKNASFTMPAKNVTVTATWKRTSSSGGGGGVVTPAVTGVKIKAAPDKVSYTEGDELDLTGLRVTLTYSNGTTKDIAFADFGDNKITVKPKAGNVLDADDKEIVITVNGKTVKQAITVKEDATVTPPVKVPVLTDISGHWAQANIDYLVEMGAIAGYPDNTFRPDNSITRAEFAVVIVKAFDLKAASGKVFDDTADHWAKDYIATAAANGIVTGYSDKEFGPDELITREQMAVIIVKAAKLTTATGELTFSDKADVSAWASSWVVTATQSNLMSGYPDNTFKPQGNATRAEAVTVICNVLKK